MNKKNNRQIISVLDYIGCAMGIASVLFLFIISIYPQSILAYINNFFALLIEITLQLAAALAPGYLVLKLIASYLAAQKFNFIGGAQYELVLAVLNIAILSMYAWTAKNIVRKNQKAHDVQLILAGLAILSAVGFYKNAFNTHQIFLGIQVIVGIVTGYWVLKK